MKVFLGTYFGGAALVAAATVVYEVVSTRDLKIQMREVA